MAVDARALAEFSLQPLKANKLRSFLTMLGVIIGVSSVILMMAIGQGAQAMVMSDVNSLGSNLLMVFPGAVGQFGRGAEGVAQILGAAQSIYRLLTIFLAGVAAISLLVGGTGIMNIMLVALTERTRGSGIRMSLGATRRDILRQFLTESLLQALAGSPVGVLVGTVGAILFAQVAKMAAPVSLLSVDGKRGAGLWIPYWWWTIKRRSAHWCGCIWRRRGSGWRWLATAGWGWTGSGPAMSAWFSST